LRGARRHHWRAIPCIRRCCWCCASSTARVIWLLLDAEFLGIVLVLVYVGAVMVLFLFVVMMLDINIEEFARARRLLAARRRGRRIRGVRHRQRDRRASISAGSTLRTAPPLPATIPIRANSARRCSRATPIRRSSRP
jgi:hypothetical protein